MSTLHTMPGYMSLAEFNALQAGADDDFQDIRFNESKERDYQQGWDVPAWNE